MKSVFSWFRTIAFWEGISFLVLLLIAMPLKYMADMPQYVRIVGMLHGVLFVTYVALAFIVKEKYGKGFGWLLLALLISIIPFGTFLLEKRWKREEEAWMKSKVPA